ncbi:cytochrome protein [Nemania abortiva]|nr:cytochrome protein [Nemania abortiva]
MFTTKIFGGSIPLAIVIAIAVIIALLIFNRKPSNLPPGPNGFPLLGNLKDLAPNGEREWEHWLKHKDVYGPISSITVLGTTMIILHSADLAIQLLEKRSSISSSRPGFVMAEIVGWNYFASLMPSSKLQRFYRKTIHLMVGTQATVMPYVALQETEAHRFLFRTLERPESLLDHIRTETGAIILKIVYGYNIEISKPDPLVRIVDIALRQISIGLVSGRWLVEFIPALRHIPEWMPGAGWKRATTEWRATLKEASEKPLNWAQRQITTGDPKKSFVKDFYNNRGGNLAPADYLSLKSNAFLMYAAGVDTSSNTLTSFFLAMIMFPDVQRKAHEEIDRVIGTERLPTFGDRESLPYIDAIVMEAWRWHPVLPMGLPHVTTAEEVVGGYHIPKGAVIMPNVWWFTHDPTVYPDPSAFEPSRYLGPNPAVDPKRHIFGYGRRICSGRYLATATVWVTIARSLAVFNITKGLDENGCEIEPTAKFLPGLLSRPADFKATIKPRSPQHEVLIRQLEDLHPWEKSNADELEDIAV